MILPCKIFQKFNNNVAFTSSSRLKSENLLKKSVGQDAFVKSNRISFKSVETSERINITGFSLDDINKIQELVDKTKYGVDIKALLNDNRYSIEALPDKIKLTNFTAPTNPSDTVGASFLRSSVVQNKSQSSVWSKVSLNNKKMNAVSSTSNYRDSYESKVYKDQSYDYIDHYIKLAEKNPSYVGIIVETNNKISCLDVFGNNTTFKNLWPKLLKSYIQEAIDKDQPQNEAVIKSSESFLRSLLSISYSEIPNVGMGNEYTINAKDRSGNSLIFDNDVIHIALFVSKDEQENQFQQSSYENIPQIMRNRN